MARRASLFVLACTLAGCYLFSDEPKARKQADSGAEKHAGEEAALAGDEGEGAPGLPADSGQDGELVGDCPDFLTGTETRTRTITSACEGVRVRGQYRIDGGELILAAGVTLHFEAGAVLEVGRSRPGRLEVQGSAEQPVRMVAAASEESEGEAGEGEAGEVRWQGLRLFAQAGGSSLSHLEIAGAGGPEGPALEITGEGVSAEELRIAAVVGGPAVELALSGELDIVDLTLAGGGTPLRSTPAALGGLRGLHLDEGAAVAVRAGEIRRTVEWSPGRYEVEGVVRVEGDLDRPAGLSLSPGTVLEFSPGARVVLGGLGPGSLSARADLDFEAGPPGVEAPEGLREGGAVILRGAVPDGGGPVPAGAWAGIHVRDHGALTLEGVELAHGGERDEGVILAEGDAHVRLEGCELHDDLVGVELRGASVSVEAFAANRFVDVPVALRLAPEQLGTLAADNIYDEHTQIELSRGRIEHDTKWARQDAPIFVRGDVFVDKGAGLTVAPGTRLRFAAGVVLGVGYYERGALAMRGTIDAPIILEPAEAGQRWVGVVLGDHTRDTHLEHVHLRGTSGAAGVEARDAAEATLVKVDCASCAGASVRWACASKVGNIGVSASEGTPTAMLAPTGCK
ncbi:hypothetical protein G6O69_17375 [Pseudenhygromyxa sp. WMMC2535]|uniref:hypothetical protein n=1 Tax=Pseudenhygromyxa sp. WMMC2535 TaxID=2712867 RepID=UPI00155440D5|nr:hypothetical protein [Pseudenhygromyxa sp. WMMC2535]NVB39617.1 hypothetical protein [Pseudenhygromyxa sp. WMMC2535]